jgi:ribosomal protein S18 acetylase RimI-like enzyme
VDIRPYKSSDLLAVVKLLKLNTPGFFSESEENDLVVYLQSQAEDYFVIEAEGDIIAAGGINYFHNSQEARISWDIVHPDAQGKGVGKKLLEFRIEYINTHYPKIDCIVVRTSQLVYPFYAKAGFKLKSVEKDYWAKGFDLYCMQLKNRN